MVSDSSRSDAYTAPAKRNLAVLPSNVLPVMVRWRVHSACTAPPLPAVLFTNVHLSSDSPPDARSQMAPPTVCDASMMRLFTKLQLVKVLPELGKSSSSLKQVGDRSPTRPRQAAPPRSPWLTLPTKSVSTTVRLVELTTCSAPPQESAGKHSAVVEFESLHAPARLSENVVRAIRMVDMDVGLWLMAPPDCHAELPTKDESSMIGLQLLPV
mmetsp:Transcript_5887/g.18109  ORF Transcript_5887/g.18109 Transcript_5887/m.18109 type:complete len:212 (-) Transcript_5887:601-1236(-)